MDESEEPDLDSKEVILKSESEEGSECNDCDENFIDDNDVDGATNMLFRKMADCNSRKNTDIVKIECDVDVSNYNMENIDNNMNIDGTDSFQNPCEKVFYQTHCKNKRKFVSMETKLEAIKKLDQGEKVRNVANELGVGEVTVGDWRRNRAKIEKWCMEKCSEDASTSRKTMKRSDFSKTSEALFLWFSQERLKGIPISGPMLQEKALYFHKQFQDGDGSFTASVGWLDRWKKRYGVRRLTMCGEKLSLDLEAVETFQNKLHFLISDEKLTADQLYNCDETGLKYKTLPSLSRQEIGYLDYQKSKERVTILACCNASGQHRLPLMLIGKNSLIEPLKSVQSNKLPVSFKSNKNSLIDSDIFKEWFEKEFVPKTEAFLKERNLPHKAVLILDSASSHPSEKELTSGGIRTLFLPPSYTSLLQPLNQGIFTCFKINYRINLLKMFLEKENNVCHLKNINLKDIVHHLADSWYQLPDETLTRAWKKLLTSSEGLDEIEDVEGKAELISLIKKIPGYECADESMLQLWFEQDDSYEVFSKSSTEKLNDDMSAESSVTKGGSVGQNGLKQNKAFHAKGLAALDLALRYIKEQKESTSDDVRFIERWKSIAEKNLSQFHK